MFRITAVFFHPIPEFAVQPIALLAVSGIRAGLNASPAVVVVILYFSSQIAAKEWLSSFAVKSGPAAVNIGLVPEHFMSVQCPPPGNEIHRITGRKTEFTGNLRRGISDRQFVCIFP